MRVVAYVFCRSSKSLSLIPSWVLFECSKIPCAQEKVTLVAKGATIVDKTYLLSEPRGRWTKARSFDDGKWVVSRHRRQQIVATVFHLKLRNGFTIWLPMIHCWMQKRTYNSMDVPRPPKPLHLSYKLVVLRLSVRLRLVLAVVNKSTSLIFWPGQRLLVVLVKNFESVGYGSQWTDGLFTLKPIGKNKTTPKSLYQALFDDMICIARMITALNEDEKKSLRVTKRNLPKNSIVITKRQTERRKPTGSNSVFIKLFLLELWISKLRDDFLLLHHARRWVWELRSRTISPKVLIVKECKRSKYILRRHTRKNRNHVIWQPHAHPQIIEKHARYIPFYPCT